MGKVYDLTRAPSSEAPVLKRLLQCISDLHKQTMISCAAWPKLTLQPLMHKHMFTVVPGYTSTTCYIAVIWLHLLLIRTKEKTDSSLFETLLLELTKCSTCVVSAVQASEAFLQRMVALYASSHYKNTPNDLILMSDAPAHHLFALLGPVDETQVCLNRTLAICSLHCINQYCGTTVCMHFCIFGVS